MSYVTALGDAAYDSATGAFNAAIAAAVKRGAPPDVVAQWQSANIPGTSDASDLTNYMVDINAWQPGSNAFGFGGGGKILGMSPMVAGAAAVLTAALVAYVVWGK